MFKTALEECNDCGTITAWCECDKLSPKTKVEALRFLCRIHLEYLISSYPVYEYQSKKIIFNAIQALRDEIRDETFDNKLGRKRFKEAIIGLWGSFHAGKY